MRRFLKIRAKRNRRTNKKKRGGRNPDSKSIEANKNVYYAAFRLYENLKVVETAYKIYCDELRNDIVNPDHEKDARKKINDYMKDLRELRRLVVVHVAKKRKFSTARMQVILLAKQIKKFLDKEGFKDPFSRQKKELEKIRKKLWDLQLKML